MKSDDTKKIVLGLKARDLGAVQDLVRAYYPTALCFMTAQLGDGAQAQAQAISFMRKICVTVETLKPDTDFDLWFLKALLSHWRGLSKPVTSIGNAFEAAFHALPETENMALILNTIMQIPSRACAQALNLTLTRFESLLRQGRARLEMIRKDQPVAALNHEDRHVA